MGKEKSKPTPKPQPKETPKSIPSKKEIYVEPTKPWPRKGEK